MENLFLPHLNTQTNSNLSFSFITVPKLVNWASENKLNYLAIADYYPYEIIEFFKLCKEKKIKPIWGVKIFLQETVDSDSAKTEKKKYSATVYPQNARGYKEVLQKLFSPDSPKDRTFSPDYILSSLSKNCLIVFEASKLEEIKYFVFNWILLSPPKKEITHHNLFIGFNFFFFSPTKTITPNIIPFLLPFFSVKTLVKEEIKLLGLWKKTSFSRHFFPADQQGNFFFYLNTDELFAFCTDDKTFYQLLLVQWQTFCAKINLNPSFRSEKINKTKKNNALLTLKSKCWQKLLALPKGKELNYQKTLEKELEVIEGFNYVDYFLVFSDAVNYLREKDIMVGPGRGSAVSSLVAYLLGITNVDPLQHHLFFERFLNEKRKSPPDIDLDIEDQEEVFRYLQQKYPKNRVTRIITKEKIGWKSALKEVGKVCKIEESKLKEIFSVVGGQTSDFSSLKLQSLQLHYPVFFALSKKISNLYYNSGIHPAGVIIAENSLVGSIPLKSENNCLVALFEADKLNYLGLKKYDFLSLKETFNFINFSFIREVREFLRLNLPSYQDINLQDKKTWEMFDNFLLTNIFQLDTSLAREVLMIFRPQTFSELVIFLALNRPGARWRAREISQAKLAKKKLDFVPPLVKEILAETYGFIIFEEQISQIFTLVYDCSFAEAEVKRRELTKKGLEKDFLIKAKKKMSLSESNFLYRQITSSFGYIFNKAHAVAYAYLTYYAAYLKANFFPEIITHLLNEKKEKTLSCLQEAFFYSFQVRKPDINYSQIEWTKKEKTLIMGFSSLRNYREEFFQEVINERNKGVYQNWGKFLDRTVNYWKKIDIITFESWIKVNLFQSLKVDNEILLKNSKNILRYLQIRQTVSVANIQNLPFIALPLTNKREGELSKKLKNEWEQENLGLYVSYFSRWKELSQKSDYKITPLLEISSKINEYNNQKAVVNIYAIISQIEEKPASNYFLFLQDIRSSFKLKISEKTYQENKEKLIVHNELLFTLEIEIKEGKINSLMCEKISSI